MPRVAYGVARHRKHKRVLKKARGFWGGRHRLYRTAKESLIRAEAYATRDRRMRKRDFRRLWITRINAASREHGLSYSQFMHGLSEAGVGLDRKVLAEIAVEDPRGFEALANTAKTALA